MRARTLAEVAIADKILDYLGAHRVMTVATAEPWAAAVFYASDGYVLHFLSSPRSRHAQHLARDPRAAVTIQGEPADWRDIQGLQLEGTVHAVPSNQQGAVRTRYLAKFPALATPTPALAPVLEALARIHWYAFVPTRACFVDNTVAFGHRECLDLS